jgi:hypothetical protein
MSKYEKFKIGLLGIFVFGFIFCFYNYTQKGRYIFSNNREDLPLIIDSSTGDVYSINGRKKISLENYKSIK